MFEVGHKAGYMRGCGDASPQPPPEDMKKVKIKKGRSQQLSDPMMFMSVFLIPRFKFQRRFS
ncbi:MAG: hypothetical protein QXX12_03770 [Nanopusillaceae archaeon]